jgi:hypothetical protein
MRLDAAPARPVDVPRPSPEPRGDGAQQAVARAASAGLAPRRLSTLEVRGRRTGLLTSFPVVVADHQDERYLVAMLGERVN